MSLDPAVVAAIDDLELAARMVVEGVRAGGHRSPFHGYSAEFQQHRPYQAGDDLKYLDWKILARTDRLYSRQFRETTSMSVMLVLDTSASMAFPADGVSKFRYACVVAASLAYLVSSQGDAVGLMTSAGDRLSYLPARGGRLHLRSLIARIERLEPGGSWNPALVVSRGAELLKRRGVVMVLSDFYDAEDETRRALRRVARSGHDVAMLQVVSAAEATFPYQGNIEFADLETGQRQTIDAGAAAREYRSEMDEFLARCRDHANHDGVEYAIASTDVPPERFLRDYLLKRGGKHQSRHAARMNLA